MKCLGNVECDFGSCLCVWVCVNRELICWFCSGEPGSLRRELQNGDPYSARATRSGGGPWFWATC